MYIFFIYYLFILNLYFFVFFIESTYLWKIPWQKCQWKSPRWIIFHGFFFWLMEVFTKSRTQGQNKLSLVRGCLSENYSSIVRLCETGVADRPSSFSWAGRISHRCTRRRQRLFIFVPVIMKDLLFLKAGLYLQVNKSSGSPVKLPSRKVTALSGSQPVNQSGCKQDDGHMEYNLLTF